MTCPRCGAAAEYDGFPHIDFTCGSITFLGEISEESDQCKLRQIAALCRQHANPASNVGAHALAKRILEIVEPQGE